MISAALVSSTKDSLNNDEVDNETKYDDELDIYSIVKNTRQAISWNTNNCL